jgi:serine/threonine protein kinase
MALLHAGSSDSGERVVIKVPRKVGDGKDDIRLEKIKVEAEILRSLSHRNIVRYLDEKDDGYIFYLIIEMINGPTFTEKYRHHPLEESTVRDTALNLLDALRYVHGYNIIHRDISPQNIMLGDFKKPILIDWGAAKQGWVQLTPGAPGATQIGKPGWSAPEQFTTGTVTPCSDIYALGAVMFFMLTGQEPRQHMSSTGGLLRTPREINRSISQEMSNVVKTAMDPDCSRRFQTATDMLNMINRGRVVQVGAPHIIFQGSKFEIKKQLEIGRTHPKCIDCAKYGQPDIKVNDPRQHLSKHHARINVDQAGRCWIEDLGSINKTAISQDSGKTFRVLQRLVRETLHDKDVVAVVYNHTRGPYMTFTYREN